MIHGTPNPGGQGQYGSKQGPWLDKASNFWRLVVCRNKTNEKSEINDRYFRPYFVTQGAGGPRNPKNHCITQFMEKDVFLVHLFWSFAWDGNKIEKRSCYQETNFNWICNWCNVLWIQ